MLFAIDGQKNGVDRCHIKIWDKTTNVIVYDNQRGNNDLVDPTTAISGGSIVIHK
jgi:hypothetical protein